VLEDNDLQLSNAQVIYEALVKAERRLSPRPDEVHLLVTCIEPEWWYCRLRYDELDFYQLSRLGAQPTSCDPASLVDIMALR
jgi:hypothetical protein